MILNDQSDIKPGSEGSAEILTSTFFRGRVAMTLLASVIFLNVISIVMSTSVYVVVFACFESLFLLAFVFTYAIPFLRRVRNHFVSTVAMNALLKEKTKELKKTQLAALSMMEDAQREELRLAFVNDKLEATNLQLKKVSSQLVSTVFALDQHAIVAKTNRQGIITEVNDKFCAISGYSRAELIGKTHRIINSGVHPSTFFKEFWETIRAGKIWKGEICNRKKNGEFYWVDTTIVPIRDGKGEIVEYVAIRADITAKKTAESQLNQVNLLLTKSNEDLQQFAYVASHDLQEPLRVIASYIQLFEMKNNHQFDEKSQKYMGYIRSESQRIQSMINDLLEYSRVGSKGGKFEWTNLEVPLQSAMNTLQRSIQKNDAQIIASPLPYGKFDSLQMALLFQNLIGNAIKFRGRLAPVIKIGVDSRFQPPAIYVEDNGVGIDKRYFDRIFKIFQRLHSVGEYPGTGIGLAVCKRIMERHHGEIWVESEEGEGSRFYFSLPELVLEKPEPVAK